MKQIIQWAFVTAATMLIISVAPALADDDIDGYVDLGVDVAPLDEEGSAEYLRESGELGFDKPGPLYIDEADCEAGAQDDGTWVPDVPDVPPPTIVEEEDE